jgi:hypothetical protein
MKIHRSKVLEFYDIKPSRNSSQDSPVSSITGLIGEDLVLGLLCRHLKGDVISHGCRPGTKSGRRLDAWVRANGRDYQVEVKNWCAHSLGQKTVPVSDSLTFREHAKETLSNFLTLERNLEGIWKILGPMRPPEGAPEAIGIPLLALWAPVATEASAKEEQLPCWFTCDLADYKQVIPRQYADVTHTHIHIFSASLYLRTLSDEVLDIEMPRATDRIRRLAQLVDIET